MIHRLIETNSCFLSNALIRWVWRSSSISRFGLIHMSPPLVQRQQMNERTMLRNPKFGQFIFWAHTLSFTVYTFVSFAFSFSRFHLALSVCCICVYFMAIRRSTTENECGQHTTRVRHTESDTVTFLTKLLCSTLSLSDTPKSNKNNNNHINLYV